MKTSATSERSPRKTVGIWIRVSTEDQARGDSPEHHERRARAYAESRDWEIKEVYRLYGVSGKDIMEHSETKRMLQDMEKGRITGLIFSKLARLARNTRHLLDLADKFKHGGADLISLQESIDTSTPAGRLFYTMIAAMAQWEREEIGDRVAASVRVRAELGKPLGGDPPFGYVWQSNKLVTNPNEAPVRKLIHELFIEHRRVKSVATELNKRGYRTRKGRLWSGPSINWLLRDPSAKGLHRKNYVLTRSPGKPWGYKKQEDVIHVAIPAIVTPELWERAFALLEERRTSRQRPAKKAVHLFAGYVHCQCGRKMYVSTDSPKYRCQKCRNKIAIVDLEGIYIEQLKGYFLSPEEVAGYVAKADETLQSKEELLVKLQTERDKVQKEIDRVYRLYAEDRLTGEQFSRVFQPLETRIKQLDEEVPKLQASVDLLKIDTLTTDHILAESKNLYDRWPHLNHDEKRQVVESLTDRIVVGKGEVAIELAFFPSSKDLTNEERTLRRPAGQLDGSGNLFATVAADRAFSAAVAELGR